MVKRSGIAGLLVNSGTNVSTAQVFPIFHEFWPLRRLRIDHFARACNDRFFLELSEMSVTLEQKIEAAGPASEAGQGQPA
ncbi:hypothetical protein [Devosia sp. LC5]|uniref:hypothetical protein n=1 Tax=Devosia sp. LC5 TaxID=1502724 RepID=UPI001269422B|nr:hypothetical protein [Devosia sp. LC5]